MDDNRDKEMMRNQLIAVILMAVAFFAFFKLFPPTKQAARPPQQKAQQAQQAPQAQPVEQENPKLEIAPDAALPPAPAVSNPAEEEIALSDQDLRVVFTKIGGRLKQASVVVNHGRNQFQDLVPVQQAPDPEAAYPMGLKFTDESLGKYTDSRRWEADVAPDNKSVTFTLTLPGKALIRKQFTLGQSRHVIDVKVDYQNLSDKTTVLGMDATPAYYLYWGPNITSNDEKMYVKQTLVWRKNDKVENFPTANMTPKTGSEPYVQTIAEPDWLGVKSTYFLVAFKTDLKGANGVAAGNPKRFDFGLAAPRFELAPNAVQSNLFSVYVGPMEQSAMRAAWPTLASALQFFQPPWTFMDSFAKLLLRILNGCYMVIPNYGLGIIFLTILVRLAMYPLTLKSMKSMKRMQLLAPELQALKEKYGENQQELNQKMMEMYRERGVNPMGGCLPLLLQMPVFIALYRMLWNAYELRGAPFLFWIKDLSQPDQLFQITALAKVPFLSIFEYVNVLPILMGVAMVLSQKVAPMSGPAQNQQQKLMMTFMPVLFSFMCYSMASGLNLYILTSTVLGMVQQRFTSVGDVDPNAPKKPKTVWKRQHFYAAAQARKRQLAKEAKRERRRKP